MNYRLAQLARLDVRADFFCGDNLFFDEKPMPTDGTFLFLRGTPLTAEKNAYSINYQVTGGFCFLSSSVRRMSRNCWKETSPIMTCSNISSGFISPDL